MAGFSDAFEQQIINWSFLNTAFSGNFASPPTTVYISLHTADPADTQTNEVTGGNYARIGVTCNGTQWTVAQVGGNWNAKNANTITFPASGTVTWAATVTHFGINTAVTAGSLLYSGALTASKTVASGDIFQFLANNLSVTCD